MTDDKRRVCCGTSIEEMHDLHCEYHRPLVAPKPDPNGPPYVCGIEGCPFPAPTYEALVTHVEVMHIGYLAPDRPEPQADGPASCTPMSMTEHLHRFGHLPSGELEHAADHMAEVGIPHANDPATDIEDPTATQLCGTCLHQQRWHNVDGCHRRDPDTTELCGCAGFRDGPADIEDPTRDPNVDELPAVMTNMTPAQFQQWVNREGDIFVVYLPGQQSFILKVPEAHYQFFVAMMQQIKFCLGDQVQAVRMSVVQGPPADADATFAPGGDPAGYHDFVKQPPSGFPQGTLCTCTGAMNDRIVNPACATHGGNPPEPFPTPDVGPWVEGCECPQNMDGTRRTNTAPDCPIHGDPDGIVRRPIRDQPQA